MKIEVIKGMINNSTWIDPEKNTIYKFANENHLVIDGTNHIKYRVKKNNNKVVIQLGSAKKYFVEYVNDFILNIYNRDEKFMITPA